VSIEAGAAWAPDTIHHLGTRTSSPATRRIHRGGVPAVPGQAGLSRTAPAVRWIDAPPSSSHHRAPPPLRLIAGLLLSKNSPRNAARARAPSSGSFISFCFFSTLSDEHSIASLPGRSPAPGSGELMRPTAPSCCGWSPSWRRSCWARGPGPYPLSLPMCFHAARGALSASTKARPRRELVSAVCACRVLPPACCGRRRLSGAGTTDQTRFRNPLVSPVPPRRRPPASGLGCGAGILLVAGGRRHPGAGLCGGGLATGGRSYVNRGRLARHDRTLVLVLGGVVGGARSPAPALAREEVWRPL